MVCVSAQTFGRRHVSNEETRAKLMDRLNRIEGQTRGIRKMIDSDRGCFEILKQVDSAIGALRSMRGLMLKCYLESCLTQDLPEGERRQDLVRELVEVVNRSAS